MKKKLKQRPGKWPRQMAQANGPGKWPRHMAQAHGPGTWPSQKAKIMKNNEAFKRLELIKERMITFFDAETESEALMILGEIDSWAKESGITTIKKFCAKLKKKWFYPTNYLVCKITTGESEGINVTIKALKRRAYGFRNMNYFMLNFMQVCDIMSSRYMHRDGNWTRAGKELLVLPLNH